jgi:hypothetical protein
MDLRAHIMKMPCSEHIDGAPAYPNGLLSIYPAISGTSASDALTIGIPLSIPEVVLQTGALADRMALAVLALERMLLIFVMSFVLPASITSDFAELRMTLHMPIDSICRLVNVAKITTPKNGRGQDRTYS